MLSPEICKTINFIIKGFPSSYNARLYLIKTYEELSKDDDNNRFLVHSQEKAVWFDRLTKWLDGLYGNGSCPGSADALTFSDNNVILIEFKAGDQDSNPKNRTKLLDCVKGKITGSKETLYERIFTNIPEMTTDTINLCFYLVVDASEMGEYAWVDPLIMLSKGSSDFKGPKIEKLLNDLKDEFLEDSENLSYYKKIDIWPSSLFEQYLIREKIDSFEVLMNGEI